MIILADDSNMKDAGYVHSVSWRASHRAFCTPEFIDMHIPERQTGYLASKAADGGHVFISYEGGKPVGVVSMTGSLIEDLYILPDEQGRGLGTDLLMFAVSQCVGIPTLWILDNNIRALRLYRRYGFKETGRTNAITDTLDELEFSL